MGSEEGQVFYLNGGVFEESNTYCRRYVCTFVGRRHRVEEYQWDRQPRDGIRLAVY